MSSQKDSGKRVEAPLVEQRICLTCGFCCDGTLFLNAGLNPGERGHLPEKIEKESFSESDKEYFRLPCHYFSEKCTIYGHKRADVCSSYRCQLLKDLAYGRITLKDALMTVSEAMEMRRDILKEYSRITGEGTVITFRQLLIELGKLQRMDSEKDTISTDYEMLLARCNIFEALLIKHFRSAEDFEKMIMK